MYFWRIALFAISVVGPFVKVRLVGAATNLDTQLLYVGYYFAVQFLIPLVDFGSSWSSIRNYLEIKDKFILYITPLGVVVGTLFCAVHLEIGLVILISTTMALLNYHLQVFRLLGKSIEFYLYKIIRFILDLLMLLVLLKVSIYSEKNIVAYILSIELISIVTILLFIKLKRPERITYIFRWFYFSGSQDYSFLILKVIRANFTRLLYPVMFSNPQFIKFFYLLLLYELIVQFANAEYIRRIVSNRLNLKYAFILILLLIPIQLFLLFVFSELMSWHFRFFEYVFVSLIGSITIYSIFSFRLISLGWYQNYQKLVFYDVILKIVIFLGLYAVNASYSEALMGILLNYLIWFGWFAAIHNRAENAIQQEN